MNPGRMYRILRGGSVARVVSRILCLVFFRVELYNARVDSTHTGRDSCMLRAYCEEIPHSDRRRRAQSLVDSLPLLSSTPLNNPVSSSMVAYLFLTLCTYRSFACINLATSSKSISISTYLHGDELPRFQQKKLEGCVGEAVTFHRIAIRRLLRDVAGPRSTFVFAESFCCFASRSPLGHGYADHLTTARRRDHLQAQRIYVPTGWR